jgi:hypothetical protein
MKWLILLASLLVSTPGWSDDAAVKLADRAAIERVYHSHRLGTKASFDEAMPPGLLDRLVRQDQRKESVLRKTYGVEVSPAMIAAEVRRIDRTTRAPEVLAEIKAALGNDPERFARAMVRPILVERALRARFDNDDTLHAAQRRAAELARDSLLAKQAVKDLGDVTWQLAPRPADEPPAPPAAATPPTEGKASSSAYSVEATAQLAQALASPGPAEPGQEKRYFGDLDPELQKVLRVQLQVPGDVSAVIELPGGFLIFIAREITAEALAASSLSIPKRGYEEWLASQPQP